MVKLILGQNDLATTHPNLAAQWHPTKNNITPQQITAGSTKKIWWQCKHGHEWEAACYSRAAGNGCPICSGRQVLAGFSDLATVCPDIAKQWHPSKNEGITAQDVTANSHKKVWWSGDCGHEWDASIAERVRGRGCPFCKSKRVAVGINDLATVCSDIAAYWNHELNEISPSEVLPQSNKLVWWTCDNGHDYQMSPSHRTREGAGCPICSNKQVLVGFNDLATTHPELAEQWHPTKNVLTPQDITIGAEKKVWWVCEKDHEWEALVYSRQHSGCPYCSGNKVQAGFNDLATTRPDLAAEWHIAKNGELTPNDVTAGSNRKVWWFGSCGHEWEAAISSRSSGCGCPLCDEEKKTSFPEKAVFLYVSQCFPDAIPNHKFEWSGKRSVDMYIPSLRTAIEYDGNAWHQEPERDVIKNQLCMDNGIRLIRIREPKCPAIDGECILLASNSTAELENAISYLLTNVLHTSLPVNVDLDRDRDAVIRLIRGNSVSVADFSPELAEEWHRALNAPLSPDQVSYGSNKKVWWRCKMGHEWQDTCNHRSHGRGCPVCAKKRK